MSIARYIREIGRGREGARSLDREEAHDLMAQVLDRRVTDLEIGAFALAMRIKGESVAELVGFLEAAAERSIVIDSAAPTVVLPSYNGSRRIANLTALLALLLARRGIRVLVHGQAADSARVTTAEIFDELRLRPAGNADEVNDAWDRGEPAFVPTEVLCPPLLRLLEVRNVVGLRNSGHTIAKLLPGCAGDRVLRVMNYTHPEYGLRLAEFVAATGASAMLMRGTEGEPVADARRLHKLDVFIAGEHRAELSLPAQAGVVTQLPSLPATSDAASTAAYIRSILSGAVPAPRSVDAQVACLAEALATLESGTADETPP